MPERYICIHGHFYQPPRENPWLEAIERQDSAYPYHDWNERITAECYGPNGTARILDAEGRIAQIVNNYARISFNIGPTLLAWMAWAQPHEYTAILDADRESQRRFSGHGSAIAQVYNHAIMPLANTRDKRTQIRWGIADFQARFGRMPEGMWLAETAVDTETLELLAEEGIAFTVLSPYQAARVRPLETVGSRQSAVGSREKSTRSPQPTVSGRKPELGTQHAAPSPQWEDVAGGRIDPSRAYVQQLPSGRSIALFFYDGPVSQGVAFEGLLSRGETFANRLLGALSDERDWPQLMHIATDGESYGHHHRYGEMALAYALETIEASGRAQLTNYGEFLAKHPPTWAAEIVEDSAWSCAHGVGRWERDCGCNTGGRPDWNQQWRAPLRRALDGLRDAVAPQYEAAMGCFVADPWVVRDDYLRVVLDRTDRNADAFLAAHNAGDLTEDERIAFWQLLEMQRHALLMYTSCGWFFDELSGIETVQVIQYAGRVIQLAERLFDEPFEASFLAVLDEAQSNIAEFGTGRDIYERFVRPAMVSIPKVAAHYAISSLFETYADRERIYCYRVEAEDYQTYRAGRERLVVGRARFTSAITGDHETLAFGVFSFGDHNISGGVRPDSDTATYDALVTTLADAFGRGDFTEVIRALDREFTEHNYSLKTLFRDEQRKILDVVLGATLEENAAIYRSVYENHVPLMRFLNDLAVPLPLALRTAADFVLNTDLRDALATPVPDAEAVRGLLANTDSWGVTLDTGGLDATLKTTVNRLMDRFRTDPDDRVALRNLTATVRLATTLPFRPIFGAVQNAYWKMLHSAAFLERDLHDRQGDAEAREWVNEFLALGDALTMQVGGEALERVRATPTFVTITQEVLKPQRVPRATYRFQFRKEFTFRDALALVPYLHGLGISDVYASPIFKATPGSAHGYDIIDHAQINPEIGTEAEFNALTDALHERGMGLLLDVVPNHMGIGHPDNIWWQDVLENGVSSIYARHFDINWHPLKRELENKVLIPILGDHYGQALQSDALKLCYEGGAFHFAYYTNVLPVAPDTYGQILALRLDDLSTELGADSVDVDELQSILTACANLPPHTEEGGRQAERNREKEVIKRRIATLSDGSASVRAMIDDTLARSFNDPAPGSRDRVDALLSAQPYRPAYWRVATDEINYRRFFDINTLAAIRVEVPDVFDATHALVLRWLAEGKQIGLRIDHPDGLRDPTRYFRTLQEQYAVARVRAALPEAERRDDLEARVLAQFAREWDGESEKITRYGGPLYVVAEKILSEGENLPPAWPIAGTTGYDWLNAASGLFVNGANADAFDALYAEFTKKPHDFDGLVNTMKKRIMNVSLSSEINYLAYLLERISEGNRMYRDFTLNNLTFALREVIAALPVYRTYATDESRASSEQDAGYVEQAVAEAKRRNPRTEASIFDFVGDTVLLRNLAGFDEDDQTAVREFVLKWQQVSGPVMAKGVEDTTFYIYNRLASLNEVGGHPSHFGVSPAQFHAENAHHAEQWPHTLLSSATHDTKRGEDTRARMHVLSEMPAAWNAALVRWGGINAAKKTYPNGPDRNDEYLLYQTLLGTWPTEAMDAEALAAYRARIREYMLKAIKEAKEHTSWVRANEEYDAAMQGFVDAVLPDAPEDAFLKAFTPLARTVAYFGVFNSLAQQLLKLTSPGVPDVYQGTEAWDFALVDPDNRRPVDYAARQRMLDEMRERMTTDDRGAFARALLDVAGDGCVKVFLTHAALAYRRDHAPLFLDGGYLPLHATGTHAAHTVAFARTAPDGDTGETREVLTVVPRLVATLMQGNETVLPLSDAVWGDTALVLPHAPEGTRYRDALTGAELTVQMQNDLAVLPLGAVFAHFPAALLERI